MINKLSDTAIRKASFPTVKQMADGGGLYLKIRASGSKKFEFRYVRPATKKQNWMFIGDWPDVSLKAAREKARDYRLLLSDGIDPQYQDSGGAYSFGEMAESWFVMMAHEWSAGHLRTTRLRYDNYIAGPFADIDIRQLSAIKIYKLLESVAKSGSYQTAEKLSYIFNGVFNRARTLGIVDLNPAYGLISQVSKTSVETPMAHFNLTRPGEKERFAKFLNDIHGMKRVSASVKSALMLAPYVFLRPANLAGLRKDQVDLKNRLIEIKSGEMKKGHSNFIVPLPDQALKIIEGCLELSGKSDFVFTSPKHRTQPITTESLSKAKQRLGWGREDATIHGLRHTAITYLTEAGFSYEATELQLHHKIQGVRGVYNKAQLLNERKRMMQAWADFIDTLLE